MWSLAFVTLFLLQAAQGTDKTGGWDTLHMWDGLPWYYRYYSIYALVVIIAAVVTGAGCWRRLSSKSGKYKRVLTDVCDGVEKGDREAVITHVKEVSEWSPEAGLRKWASLPDYASQEALRALQQADLQFRLSLAEFRLRARFLLTQMGLVSLLYLAALSIDIHAFADATWMEKSVSWRAYVGWIHESQEPFGLTVWTLLIVFLAYRHISKHIELRQSQWDSFRLRVGIANSASKTVER